MFFVGVDLGQRRDHTAVVVVERIEHRRVFMGTQFDRLVERYAQRMALGMPYPQVVERLREIVRADDLFYGRCTVTVDASGVGAPVVDMMNAARLACPVTAITITGGERASKDCVPKRDLMAEVLVLLENRKLSIGRLREGPQLARELCDVRERVHANGRVRLGAEGSGEHDDLVIALALACWSAKGRECVREGTRQRDCQSRAGWHPAPRFAERRLKRGDYFAFCAESRDRPIRSSAKRAVVIIIQVAGSGVAATDSGTRAPGTRSVEPVLNS